MSFITKQLKTESETMFKKLEEEIYLFTKKKLKEYGNFLDNTKPIQEAFKKASKRIDKELNDIYKGYEDDV